MNFDANSMEKAFSRLGELAIEEGKTVDIAVYGGSALAVAYNLRSSTRDVDAVFEKDKAFVNKAVAKVASEMGLPEDWLNDAVKGYVSPNEPGNMILFGSFPSEAEPGLRVFVPAPEYFFAMKCIDIRTGASSKDVDDVRKLAGVCGIQDASTAMDIVESFYPDRKIPPKTRFAMEEIFESLPSHNPAAVGRSGFKEALDEFREKREASESSKIVNPVKNPRKEP